MERRLVQLRYAAAAEALSNAARKLPVRGPARLRLATLATRLVAGENVFDKVRRGGAGRGG